MYCRLRWILMSVFALSILTGADAPKGNLDIYFIDVMGGAATLLVTPERESILIDSGWPGFNDRDPRRIALVLRDVAGLDHLDHLVTTHWHMDHFGGVAGLSKLVRIDHFWDRGLPDYKAPEEDKAAFPDGPKPDDPLGVAYRKASEGKRSVLKAGDEIRLKGKIEAVVLASGGEVIFEGGKRPADNTLCASAPADLAADPSDNARSLAIRFRLGKFGFLDCGDLTWNVEKKLVCPWNVIGPIDLFQVTHHGMAISNHPTLVESIKPTVAVMDNGPRKGGDAKAVALLKSIPSIKALYQLHKNAATTDAENTESALIANKDPEGGQFIHASVAPDGTSFTVQIGTDGPIKKFESQ